MNSDKFKQYLIILGFAFPLILLTSFFTLITFNIPYANPLMFILLIGLIFIYYVIIRFRINSIAYGNYLQTSSQRRRIIIFMVDVLLTSVLLIRKSFPLALIFIGLWLLAAFIMSFNKLKKQEVGESKKQKRNHNVIDIDEEGNIID